LLSGAVGKAEAGAPPQWCEFWIWVGMQENASAIWSGELAVVICDCLCLHHVSEVFWQSQIFRDVAEGKNRAAACAAVYGSGDV